MEKSERNKLNMKVIGRILPSLPFITLKFLRFFLVYKRQAKKAGKIFKKELRKQGLNKTAAEELTDIYLSSSRLRQYIQGVF